MVEYWLRILGALALIKVASTLVRDAEKLITANVKARNPEIADDIDSSARSMDLAQYQDRQDGAPDVMAEADPTVPSVDGTDATVTLGESGGESEQNG